MKRFFAIVLLAVMILPMRISAQSLSKQNQAPVSFSNFVTNSFINYYTTGGVQEKLYVVTDKPFYSAGDTIYFSAFLVNSIYFNRTTDTHRWRCPQFRIHSGAGPGNRWNRCTCRDACGRLQGLPEPESGFRHRNCPPPAWRKQWTVRAGCPRCS